MNTIDKKRKATGLLMGAGAILLWSFSATCVVFGGRRLGIWQFLALTAPAGFLLQCLAYRVMGRRWGSLFALPPRLWLAVAFGFVFYALAYNTALITAASDAQAVGVTLMNYLWPAMTVALSLLLVPGERFSTRLALAAVISVVAVAMANGRDMLGATASIRAMPYILGAMAGLSWAMYCALMARWREWAQGYATAPIGFLLTGTIAAAIAVWRGEWQPLDTTLILVVAFAALGPSAGGYMLWELALHRAPVSTLSIMGAATPLLSTLWMLLAFAATSAAPVPREKIVSLITASMMISIAVILSRMKPGRAK